VVIVAVRVNTEFGFFITRLISSIIGPLRMGTRPILLRRDYVQSTKPNIFATITTDILLLLIMLLGLFRMGCDGVGMSGLARFLWKQVTLCCSLAWYSRSVDRLTVHQGVFWLLIAIVAEVPPVVKPPEFFLITFYCFSPLVSIKGAHYLGYER
jgi:hypothetical protein